MLENLSLANNRENSLKINDLLNDFDLNKDKNNLAGDLSHGEKQWLDIALSTISKPDLVFLDDPLQVFLWMKLKLQEKLKQS